MFGSILIDDQEAIKTIVDSEKQAKAATKSFDKMADAGVKIGEFVVKGAAVAAGAIIGLVGKGTKSADDLAKAINGVEAATGLADDSSTGFKDTMLEIYNNNFGDSFEDIGQAMAEITKQTGLTGDELKETTEYALMLRDTYEFEVTESIRAAEMMMDTFGVTSEEAYNLIAQGAQNGLDKNGDLLDSVNEYSMYFEGLGINADEMFNMLVNGAEDGTFSVDKLGDAMKEFSIRSIDGSDATAEAFEMLGLNAGDMATSLASGGEEANNALFRMADALFEMEDPLKQNEVGVALFGTMWEDVGADGVNALLNVNGELDSTKNSMDQINNTKYDSVGKAISGIGRNFETGVLIPIGEKVLPIIQELADKFQEKMPQIQAFVESGVDVAAGLFDDLATAIQWVSDNLNIIIPLVAGLAGGMTALMIIGTVTGLIRKWKAFTDGMAASQAILNAVLNANPLGVIITLIGLVIAAGVALYMNWDKVKAVAINLWNSMKTIFGNIKNAVVNAFSNMTASARAKMDEMRASAQRIFNRVYDAIMKPINRARDAVKNAIEKMKGFFNFNWKLPKIKMPKFSVSGSMNPINWLKDGVPKLSVKWNAKGGIFDKPTIFNTASGLQGVGEAGPEAILPLNDNTYAGMGKGIAEALSKMIQPQATQDNRPIYIQLDGKTIAIATRDHLDEENGRKVRLIDRGLARG